MGNTNSSKGGRFNQHNNQLTQNQQPNGGSHSYRTSPIDADASSPFNDIQFGVEELLSASMDIDPPHFEQFMEAATRQRRMSIGGGILAGEDGSKPEYNPKASQSATQGIPTVFEWQGGPNPPKSVMVVGSFSGWRKGIPLSRSTEDFTTILYLPEGKHEYKFVVDDMWQHNPEQPTTTDEMGNVNNVISVKKAAKFNFAKTLDCARPASPPGEYSQIIPAHNPNAKIKEPPHLPAYLHHPLLNKAVNETDATLLPIPHHVMLNHLYVLSLRESVVVLGLTHRHEDKFVTTVLYKPRPASALTKKSKPNKSHHSSPYPDSVISPASRNVVQASTNPPAVLAPTAVATTVSGFDTQRQQPSPEAIPEMQPDSDEVPLAATPPSEMPRASRLMTPGDGHSIML
eukprot:TRINITY_DN4842_c0_g1_i2.p1 TRINITY_DN4842_c0_g1~~TRINITY_DN4842_c0_g1_i2.p1  ORF type:complete len:401 (-),score=51.77 TRINITY_DN4842_c0_g1_i2:49-1251(-)